MLRLFWLCMAVVSPPAEGEVRLSGRVVDENSAPVAGAWVAVRPAGNPKATALRAIADLKGGFMLRVGARGTYLVDVDHEGFFRLEQRAIEIDRPDTDVTLVLNRASEVFESIDVPARITWIDPDRTARQKSLTENQILSIPYPTTNSLRNAMRLIPGVTQDNKGGLHIDGGAEDQVLYTLDGFNISDPLTGRFESRLSVEAVRSVEVSSGRFSPEFGKGSAGAVAVQTIMGDDKLRYGATNFVPGIENHKGIQIGNWTPRLNLRGPIRKGRAWFSDSVDTQYDRNIVEELPKGQDRSTSWRLSNMARVQVTLAPSNIFYAGLLINLWNANRTGLSILDPPETTTDRRSRQWFFHAKDQVYFSRGALLEFGYAANRTFGREIPQGPGVLVMTPDVKGGNAFVNAVRRGSRDQFLGNFFVPPFTAAGTHRLKLGVDLDRVAYRQDVHRTGFDHYRENGILVRRVRFAGNGDFGRANLESSSYVQDSWRARPTLLLDIGVRHDLDRLVGNPNLSPRVGFGWSPKGLENTRISGGYAIIYDANSLRLFTRPLDQYALTTYYHPWGGVARGPAASMYVIDPLRHLDSPRYQEWSLGLEQRLPGDFLLRLDWLRKRGRNGFTYASAVRPGFTPSAELIAAAGTPMFDSVYELGNDRRDVYDSANIRVRKSFGTMYEWMASYTRSRALSNAVVDINVDDPLIISNNAGPMPWDAPNRFLSWGYLPTFWKNWALAYMVEARNGFPFSIQDDAGRILGDINSYRFPMYLEVNIHMERRLTWRGYRWALRVGCNNISGRRNPTVVNANTSSANFMSFYGGQGRTFNFRIRWLGKVAR